MRARLTLHAVLLGVVVVAILVGLAPSGIVLDRALAQALEQKARTDLELAPRLVADRNAAHSDAMMMHAKEFAHAPGLASALATSDEGSLLRVIEASRPSLGDGVPVVVAGDGSVLVGPKPGDEMIEQTRRGAMPVKLTTDGRVIRNVALAPVEVGGQWIGAAGVAVPLDEQQAGALSGLTRSSVILVSSGSNVITASTLDTTLADGVHAAMRALPLDGRAREVSVRGGRYLVVAAPLADAGRAVFVRTMRDELAVLPELRRVAALSAASALVIALLLGGLLSLRMTRPVRLLAGAATAMRDGKFDAPLPDSRIHEVALVSERFAEMRSALAARLQELDDTNEALQDRNTRLTALQSDLMQRDRLAAAGRLVAQLAHEIRNPVANLRNCLEVVRRRVDGDAQTREFVDLAIDELLRMHELAEQMLDLNRPRDTAVRSCRPVVVAREIVRLATAGVQHRDLVVQVSGDVALECAIAPDALKQVLLNLLQNAREAAVPNGESGAETRIDVDIYAAEISVRIIVRDNGPGIPVALHERVFDPFFSTKSAVHGVGLGLFVAEGLVRGSGGRLMLGDAPTGGAVFIIELPRAESRGVSHDAAGDERSATENT